MAPKPEEVPGLVTELQEAIREAHGALKDLERATAKAERIHEDVADKVQSLETAVRGEIDTILKEMKKIPDTVNLLRGLIHYLEDRIGTIEKIILHHTRTSSRGRK